MLDTEVYTKTDAGRDEIRARALGLSMAARAILLMVDGQRTVGAMRTLIAGSKAPADVLETLAAQGLIAPSGSVAQPLPTPASAPPASAPRGLDLPPPRAIQPAVRAVLPDGPLDLELPTIHGPAAEPAAPAPTTHLPAIAAIDAAVPEQNRYERLYAMMNEIVRDFLAPHRRYFFQLKIERCNTPDELVALLGDLQTALAKARGDAFASDVIARIRAAAG